eukprot:CAMPEP_0184651152 /NCGR_PEP_ID=MMETSP0308-20130426/8729_1 /TAXON_ID=38269 /ORGANISM="Gloeochaete witrockiana, Strain SAG 46.84" /LENGTH=275 /DNA_ID=CAMNT_0027085161 /DNA_START=96 /DNA_END=927 /DNA_ORIENTATION=+
MRKRPHFASKDDGGSDQRGSSSEDDVLRAVKRLHIEKIGWPLFAATPQNSPSGVGPRRDFVTQPPFVPVFNQQVPSPPNEPAFANSADIPFSFADNLSRIDENLPSFREEPSPEDCCLEGAIDEGLCPSTSNNPIPSPQSVVAEPPSTPPLGAELDPCQSTYDLHPSLSYGSLVAHLEQESLESGPCDDHYPTSGRGQRQQQPYDDSNDNDDTSNSNALHTLFLSKLITTTPTPPPPALPPLSPRPPHTPPDPRPQPGTPESHLTKTVTANCVTA